MSTTAKITKIKNKTKSKVLILGIICFQYLGCVATHAGLMVHSETKISLSYQKLPTILELQHSHALICL